MTITTAAAAMIREWLGRSPLRDPVVCLVQMCDTPPEISQALERGASKKELAQISEAALAKVPKYLYPAIYPRSRFLWILTTTIRGFPFVRPLAHPPYARRAMKSGVLDVAERGLVLKDPDGTVVMPKPPVGAL
jgi:hypothetical protein